MKKLNKRIVWLSLSALFPPVLVAGSAFSMEEEKKEIQGSPFFSTYNPSENFINAYGLKSHRRFHKLTPKVISTISDFLKEASKYPDKAQVGPFIDFVGTQRSWMAHQTKCYKKELFGKSRRMTHGYKGMGDMTPLFTSTYDYWRQQIVVWMTPLLYHMATLNKTEHQVNFKYSRLVISIKHADSYDLTEFEKALYERIATPEEALKMARYEIIFGKTFLEMDGVLMGKEIAREQALKMVDRFEDIYVISAQYFLKMGKEDVPTSTVFMRYLKDTTSDHPTGLTCQVVKELMESGGMIYEHTLGFYLSKIEHALGQYYRHILKWQPNESKSKEQNDKSLLGLLAFFHQTFDTLMPYARGSGAGAEWATRGLAGVKGFDLHLKEGVTSIVQEGLSQPDVVKFVAWYKENVILVPSTTNHKI